MSNLILSMLFIVKLSTVTNKKQLINQLFKSSIGTLQTLTKTVCWKVLTY